MTRASSETLCSVLEQVLLSSVSTGSTNETFRHEGKNIDWDAKYQLKQTSNKMLRVL